MKFIYSLLFLLTVASCSSPSRKEEQGPVTDGLVKSYRGDGKTLYQEQTLSGGKLNGVSKTYFPNGKLYLEEWYANDQKHGKVMQYYESGILYSETNYDSGKIHGVVKRYHKDGKLKAESRFSHDCPCLGLKEYILNGDPRPRYPEIVITMDDQLLTRASYFVNLTVSERVKSLEFFKGSLEDGCLHKGLVEIPLKGEERAQLDLSVGSDGLIKERFNVVAKIETIAGNILVAQKSVAVNAGYARDY